MKLRDSLFLWLLILGMEGYRTGGEVLDDHMIPDVGKVDGPAKTNTSAWVTFSTHDLELVDKEHQNATVFLVVRGELSGCMCLNFTYDPKSPTIEPLENLVICPPGNFTTSTTFTPSISITTSTTFTPSISTTTSTTLTPSLSTTSTTSIQSISTSTSSVPTTSTSTSIPSISTPNASLSVPRAPLHGSTTPHPPLVWNGSVEISSRRVGKTILGVKADDSKVDVKQAFMRVSVIHNAVWDTVSDVFGWIYTVVWDVSFLPQVYLNWRRKSVEGLSVDYIALTILAFLYYTLFNLSFFTIPLIQEQFSERYPFQVNHVRPNDVFFASWAFFIMCVTGVQCLIYHRAPKQVISWPCRILLVGCVVPVVVACGLAGGHVIWWLDVFYLMSYLKLGITPLKYFPQVFVNYKRKSTEGFSMTGMMMDFTGGIMSLAQMFMLSANNDDWLSMLTNFSKLGLGVITLVFDITYFSQYYYYHLRGKLCIHQKVKEEVNQVQTTEPDVEDQ